MWEQPLRDRLRGEPLTLEARIESQSILSRTLLLFGVDDAGRRDQFWPRVVVGPAPRESQRDGLRGYNHRHPWGPSREAHFLIAIFLSVMVGAPAVASAQGDEIQVYNGGLAPAGVFNLTWHNNYTPDGIKTPEFPGAITSNKSLNGVTEWAYGVTDWFEGGLYCLSTAATTVWAGRSTASNCARCSPFRMPRTERLSTA